ncbi:peptidoglycan-binding protein [Salicibibacter cibarius]|uniref:Peptidoglycan-binding protein n=1 Tax=Salicibibacter cibarius TaxID=2743000 RepID=A0A7T7CDF1_9BACI|nr:peptidoglycan-binding protein [Salicibibacter cibarius]QQK77927.1 peptidoglycan-binding protein [Salicibibacter cibarius]
MSIDDRTVTAESRRRFIETVQKQLIRENPSALPEYGIDGIYGEETDLAVQDFQSQEGLTVDGIAGPETNNALREAILFGEGSEGEGVEMLQEDLTWFYFEPDGGIDGIYGPGTEQAVRDFQSDNDLSVDGIAGPNTLEMMDELIETILVEEGDTNSLVRRIQEQLNEQDSVDLSIDVDGIFGPETEGAVEDFQEATDQQVDGIAGPVTMNLLDLEAVHPGTMEEFEAYFQGRPFETDITEANESDQEVFKELVESHEVYLDNNPSDETSLTVSEGLDIDLYADEDEFSLFYMSGQSGDNVYVFALFDKGENELIGLGFAEVEGDQYEDTTTLTSYDVDGEEIDAIEDTNLELTNADLDIQKEISETLLSISTQQEDDTFDEFVCNTEAAALGIITCAGLGPGAAILCGTLGAGVLATIWCPYEDNPIADNPLDIPPDPDNQ